MTIGSGKYGKWQKYQSSICAVTDGRSIEDFWQKLASSFRKGGNSKYISIWSQWKCQTSAAEVLLVAFHGSHQQSFGERLHVGSAHLTSENAKKKSLSGLLNLKALRKTHPLGSAFLPPPLCCLCDFSSFQGCCHSQPPLSPHQSQLCHWEGRNGRWTPPILQLSVITSEGQTDGLEASRTNESQERCCP